MNRARAFAPWIGVPGGCPVCGVLYNEGDRYCQQCGTPLPIPSASSPPLPPPPPPPGLLPQPTAVPPFERILGEIFPAYSFAIEHGPVRILLTDQRLLVLWTGEHSWVPRLSRLKEWRQSAGTGPSWRLLAANPDQAGSNLAWSTEKAQISNLFASRMWGAGVVPTECMLNVSLFLRDFRAGGGSIVLRTGTLGMRQFLVHGSPEDLNGFLRQTPYATRVSRSWHIGKKLG